MGYQRIGWVDHEVSSPRTYSVTINDDGTYTLIPAFGTIIQRGTDLNADNLNHMEEGIEDTYRFIGTIPHSSEATTVIGYINEKVASVTPAVTHLDGDDYEVSFGGGSGGSGGSGTPITIDDIGEGLYIDENGMLCAIAGSLKIRINGVLYEADQGIITIPMASNDEAGAVKLSGQFSVDEDGNLVVETVSLADLEDDGTQLVLG